MKDDKRTILTHAEIAHDLRRAATKRLVISLPTVFCLAVIFGNMALLWYLITENLLPAPAVVIPTCLLPAPAVVIPTCLLASPPVLFLALNVYAFAAMNIRVRRGAYQIVTDTLDRIEKDRFDLKSFVTTYAYASPFLLLFTSLKDCLRFAHGGRFFCTKEMSAYSNVGESFYLVVSDKPAGNIIWVYNAKARRLEDR